MSVELQNSEIQVKPADFNDEGLGREHLCISEACQSPAVN